MLFRCVKFAFNKKNAFSCNKSGKRDKEAHRKFLIPTNKCFPDILGYSNIS